MFAKFGQEQQQHVYGARLDYFKGGFWVTAEMRLVPKVQIRNSEMLVAKYWIPPSKIRYIAKEACSE